MISASRIRFCLGFSLLVASLFIVVGTAVAATSSSSSCGIVEETSGGLYALRNQKWVPLAIGAEIHAYESFRTNAGGRASLRFDDSSLVEIGPDTTVHTMFSIFSPQRAMFQVHMDRGEVRFQTGSIGLKNPRGIRFVTPKNAFVTRNCIANFSVAPEREVARIEWMPDGVDVSVINPASKREYHMVGEGSELITAGQDIILVNTRNDA